MKVRETNKKNGKTFTYCDVCDTLITEDYFQINKRFFNSNSYSKYMDICQKCSQSKEMNKE